MPSTFEYHNLKITWLHHASFLIETGGKTVYIDPFKVAADPTLPNADCILLTHDHFDHMDRESIDALRKHETQIVGSGSLKKSQIAGVIIAEGETVKAGECVVKAVPAYNIGSSFHQKGSGRVGFVIDIVGTAVYHAGDTDWIPEMSRLAGSVQVALLPIGGTYTMDARVAVQAVATIKPDVVIPMHYNYLDETKVTQEDLDFFVSESKKYCKEVVVLEPKL